MTEPKRDRNKEIIFTDAPEFRPNLTPAEIFQMGSFGGTYWRDICSEVTGKCYTDMISKYPKSWWKNIPDDWLTRDWDDYDKDINKYGVKVGTTLEDWEEKGWITKYAPYGWVQFYCDYYMGKRTPDDARQIDRWTKTAGPNSRFRKWLVRQIVEKGGTWDDYSVSPKIRQTLQHWAVQLTKDEFDRISKEYI